MDVPMNRAAATDVAVRKALRQYRLTPVAVQRWEALVRKHPVFADLKITLNPLVVKSQEVVRILSFASCVWPLSPAAVLFTANAC
jgi:hypothetical protein